MQAAGVGAGPTPHAYVALVRMDRAHTRGKPGKMPVWKRMKGGYGRDINVDTLSRWAELGGLIFNTSATLRH